MIGGRTNGHQLQRSWSKQAPQLCRAQHLKKCSPLRELWVVFIFGRVFPPFLSLSNQPTIVIAEPVRIFGY